MPVEIAVRSEGDVDARVWVRIREIEHSIGWLERSLAALPGGPVHFGDPCRAHYQRRRRGTGGRFRGDVLAYVRLAPDGASSAAPSRSVVAAVAAVGAAIEGNIVATSRCATSRSIAPTPDMIFNA